MTPGALFIRKLRLDRKLSQKKASIILGCLQTYLCAVERGRVLQPHQPFLDKLVDVYQLSPQEISLLKQAVEKSKGEYKLPEQASAEEYEFIHGLFARFGKLDNKKINLINGILEL